MKHLNFWALALIVSFININLINGAEITTLAPDYEENSTEFITLDYNNDEAVELNQEDDIEGKIYI